MNTKELFDLYNWYMSTQNKAAIVSKLIAYGELCNVYEDRLTAAQKALGYTSTSKFYSDMDAKFKEIEKSAQLIDRKLET